MTIEIKQTVHLNALRGRYGSLRIIGADGQELFVLTPIAKHHSTGVQVDSKLPVIFYAARIVDAGHRNKSEDEAIGKCAQAMSQWLAVALGIAAEVVISRAG